MTVQNVTTTHEILFLPSKGFLFTRLSVINYLTIAEDLAKCNAWRQGGLQRSDFPWLTKTLQPRGVSESHTDSYMFVYKISIINFLLISEVRWDLSTSRLGEIQRASDRLIFHGPTK